MTSIFVITSTFVTLFCCSIVPAVTAYCYSALDCYGNTYCSYGTCYAQSSYTVTHDKVVPWAIGVIVGGSVLGLIIIVVIIVCIVKAVKRSSSTVGTVIHPGNQPTVAVVNSNSGGGTMAAPNGWAQPAYGPTGGGYPTQPTYGPTGGGYPTQPTYGPTGGGYPTQTTYGPQLSGAPVPNPYANDNPAFAPTQAPGTSQPSNDPLNDQAYGHKS